MDKQLNMEVQEIIDGVLKVALIIDDSSQTNVTQTLVLSGMVKEGKNPNKKGITFIEWVYHHTLFSFKNSINLVIHRFFCFPTCKQ